MNQTVTINGQQFCCNVVGGIQPNGSIGIVSAGACPANPPPGGNPATLLRSRIGYGTVTGALRTVNLARWVDLFGFLGPNASEVQATVWPGKNSSGPTIMDMHNTDLVVLQIDTPARNLMPQSGALVAPRNQGIVHFDLCIALTAADAGAFRNPINPGALRLNCQADESNALSWRRDDLTHNNSIAILSPDTTYFMGIRFSPPTNAAPSVVRHLLLQQNFGAV